MPDTTYKMIEVVGTSRAGVEQAVSGALRKATKTLHGMSWFEVKEVRGRLTEKGGIEEWQVKIALGLRLD